MESSTLESITDMQVGKEIQQDICYVKWNLHIHLKLNDFLRSHLKQSSTINVTFLVCS